MPTHSFRDPDGITIDDGDRFLRFLRPSGIAKIKDFEDSVVIQALVASKQLIATDRLDDSEDTIQKTAGDWAGAVEHPKLPFISFPHEWPAKMLSTAGLLTLDIAEQLLDEGRGLKDATPYNIGFIGPKPIFLDILSIETRAPTDPIWRAEAQFVRTILLPLMCEKYFGIPAHSLLIRGPDTVTPEFVYRLAGPVKRVLPPFLWWVTLPTWLGRQHKADNAEPAPTSKSPEIAQFILKRTFKRLRRALSRVTPSTTHASEWQSYEETRLYTPDQIAAKNAFVDEALTYFSDSTILDLGCNAGEFSQKCARAGHRVVAIDGDPSVAEKAWQRAINAGEDIHVLTANIAWPTPSLGWGNAEYSSLTARLSHTFDAVLALGILHHLLVTAGIPLNRVIETFATMTRDFLIVEFIAPNDPNFRRIARGRGALHSYLDTTVFETAIKDQFDVIHSRPIVPELRTGYLLRKKRPITE